LDRRLAALAAIAVEISRHHDVAGPTRAPPPAPGAATKVCASTIASDPTLAERLTSAVSHRRERGADQPSDHVPVTVELA
jgi:hypothetical protein